MLVIPYYYPAISCFLGKISRFMDSENSEIAEFRLGHSWKLPSPPPSPGGVAPGQGGKGLRAVFVFRHARPPVCLRLIYIPTVKKSPSAFPLSEPMASQPTASLVAATPRQVGYWMFFFIPPAFPFDVGHSLLGIGCSSVSVRH